MSVLIERMIEWRAMLGGHALFATGAMLLAGYGVGKLMGRIRLPEITGFIFAGVLLGDSLLGIVPLRMSVSMKIVTEVALGLIALTIGSEFAFGKLRRIGWRPAAIAGGQLGGVFLTVWGVMEWVGVERPFAMLTASIATASSPAVAVAMVQSLRARGLFVDYLYSVVALLDAGAVILFGIVLSVATGMMGLGIAGLPQTSPVLTALSEVLFSLIFGLITGILLHLAVRRLPEGSEAMLLTLGIAFVATATAIVFHLSPLLANMTAGAVLINLSPRHHRIFRMIEPVTPPIYALFFVLAGSELQPNLLANREVLWIGGAYIVSRNLAKYATVYGSAWICRTDPAVRRNLGYCMLPQAGVALGLVLFLQASPAMQNLSAGQTAQVDLLMNVVLLSVFLNQVIGPPLSRMAILNGNRMEDPL